MTDITPREVFRVVSDNKSWVQADFGQQGRRGVTLDISTFTKAVHYPNGFIPSGTPLGEITATGKFGPYDPEATDGREKLEGFLWVYSDVVDGQLISVVPLWFGVGSIVEAKLPFPVDAAGKADVAGWFKFINV